MFCSEGCRSPRRWRWPHWILWAECFLTAIFVRLLLFGADVVVCTREIGWSVSIQDRSWPRDFGDSPKITGGRRKEEKRLG